MIQKSHLVNHQISREIANVILRGAASRAKRMIINLQSQQLLAGSLKRAATNKRSQSTHQNNPRKTQLVLRMFKTVDQAQVRDPDLEALAVLALVQDPVLDLAQAPDQAPKVQDPLAPVPAAPAVKAYPQYQRVAAVPAAQVTAPVALPKMNKAV